MTKDDAIKILCDTVLRRKQHSRLVIREAVCMVDVTPTVKAAAAKPKKSREDD